MKCVKCKKTLNKNLIKLYYFHKTFLFCSKQCYHKYSLNNHPEYKEWNKKYKSLTKKQKMVYERNLERVKKQINNKKRTEAIWVRPSKPGYDFNHVSEYRSFNDFKKAFINFLQKQILDDMESYHFSCSKDYLPDLQKAQITAINKIFDEIYGKDRVKWAFKSSNDKTNIVHGPWGPFLIIDGVITPLDYYYKDSMDKFIREGLDKNE